MLILAKFHEFMEDSSRTQNHNSENQLFGYREVLEVCHSATWKGFGPVTENWGYEIKVRS